jgi:hypothetical protein
VNVNKNHEGKFICKSSNEHGSIEKVFYIQIEISVQFSDWSEWSQCSASCGNNGVQYRSRTCILLDANPSYNCTGENVQMQKCNDIPCPVNGGWSKWTKWSTCALCYDEKSAEKPKKRRTRKCDSPMPAFGGLQCEGSNEEKKDCDIAFCPIDGNWSAWSAWSQCSATCGKGYKSRKRNCNNPSPKHNGRDCEGENIEYEECKSKPCSNFEMRRMLRGRREEESDEEFEELTENNGEFTEFEFKNEIGEPKVYQFMKHKEIEFVPPKTLPKIKITLDTYKPISEESYMRHLNNKKPAKQEDVDDDYFETEFNDSTEVTSIEVDNVIKKCGKGFKYNSIYKQCEEIDECRLQNVCKLNERCINTIGSYRCERKR